MKRHLMWGEEGGLGGGEGGIKAVIKEAKEGRSSDMCDLI